MESDVVSSQSDPFPVGLKSQTHVGPVSKKKKLRRKAKFLTELSVYVVTLRFGHDGWWAEKQGF